MTKPHEETWRFCPSEAHSGFVAFPQGGEMVVKYDPANYSHDEGAARARLAAQAPAMARLLLKVEWVIREGELRCTMCGWLKVEGEHATDCELAAVLRAAGVLP